MIVQFTEVERRCFTANEVSTTFGVDLACEGAADSVLSHDANLPENPQKSADFAWDKRQSSVRKALSSGTHFALSLAGDSITSAADKTLQSRSTIFNVLEQRYTINAHNLLLIGEQYPEVLDAWLALIGKRAVDL